jgi:hypothetical protein
MNGRDRYLSTTQGGTSQPPPVSTGTPNFSPPGQGGNNLPPQNNNTNNQGTPNTTQTTPDLTGRDAALQSAADESVDNYLLGIAEMMQGMENPPLAIDPETGQAIRSGGFKRFDPETGELDWTSGQEYVDPFTGTGDKGALLSDIERAHLFANQLGKGLGSMIATNDYGEPILDSSGNVIYTGLGENLMDNWGQTVNAFAGIGEKPGGEFLQDLEDQYWKQRYDFDADWHGSDWDEYLGEPYGGYPESASMTDPKWWTQKSLGELNPTGFANLEQMYGEELANKMAAPHAWGIAPFSETIIEGDY